MKFTTVFAVLAGATAVYAETNAERFARGLPPLPPARRATSVAGEFHLVLQVLLFIPTDVL